MYFHFPGMIVVVKSERMNFHFSFFSLMIGGKVKGRTFTLRMKVSWVSLCFTFSRSSFTMASWGEKYFETNQNLFQFLLSFICWAKSLGKGGM